MEIIRTLLLIAATLSGGYLFVKFFGGLFSAGGSSKAPTLDTDDDRFRTGAGELTSISITGDDD